MKQIQMPRMTRLNPAIRRLQGDACVPRGFLASGIAAGIKKSNTRDIAMIVSETPCCSAGVFTANSAKAAPVLMGLKMARHPVRGIVANSGNANACT
ncbi:MAG: bifunctional ornithine acetyltransferase/N-acetylglutamate synthase, partial [Verrucomicrobia bacterium]|nr:bifunctional ornithine acetyltransferase/N-acetylglutamate synthase [Verrucomicrobiota bacterium]